MTVRDVLYCSMVTNTGHPQHHASHQHTRFALVQAADDPSAWFVIRVLQFAFVCQHLVVEVYVSTITSILRPQQL